MSPPEEIRRPVEVRTPERLPVAAGEPAAVPVEVTNLLAEPVVVSVRAVGAEAGPSQPLPLAPGQTATLELTVTVPAGFPGREQSAGVEAVVRRPGAPSDDTVGRVVVPVALVLDEGADLRARLEPAEVRGARRAGVTVELENRGAGSVDVWLRDDTSRRATVDFEPAELTVPAGARRRVTATVRRGRPLLGSSRRTPFGVVVATRQRDVRLPGGFTQTPVLSRGIAGVVALIAVIAVWAAALAVGLDRVGSDDSDQKIAQAAADGSTDGTGAGIDGTGSADEGSGGSGGSGGSDEGSSATVDDGGEGEDATAGVRVGGSVDASDPGGVSVSIEPVSLTDALDSGAQFARPLQGIRMADGPAKHFGRSAGVSRQTLDDRRATTTDVDGAWAFGGVRAPGLYLVTFAKPGYQVEKFIVETKEGEEPPDLDVSLEAGPGSISGRVVTEGGDGVGGVEITATDGTVSLTTTTVSSGAVGTFSLEGLSTPATWSLTTSRTGYGAETARVDLAGSGSADGVVMTLHAGVAAIGGTVISPEGPVGGLTVEVTDGELTRTATTLTEGPTGGFLIPALPIPGVYTVSVHGDGWQALTQEVDLRGDVQLSLEMRRSTAQLVGTITDVQTGEGIAGVGITVVSDGETFKSGSAGAADDGGFELRGIPPGSYVVTFERYGYATEQLLVALSAGDRKAVDIQMTAVPPETLPDESTIQGQVRATTGEVIGGAKIEIALTVAKVDDDGNVEITEDIVEDVTDAEGNYSIGGLPPGIHRVTASAVGYASDSRSVRVGVGGAVTADFALVPNAAVTGRVISKFDNRPQAGATVKIRLAGTTEWLYETTTAAPAPGEPPQFSFDGESSVPSGVYEIQATDLADHRPSAVARVVVVAPQDVAQDLQVDRLGHLRVRVVEPVGGQLQPLSGAALTISGPNGAAVCSQIIPVDDQRTCPVTTTGEVVELAGLEPGSYTATAQLTDYVDGSSGAVAVDLNQVRDATVAMSRKPGTVTGTVEWMRDGKRTGVPTPTVTITFTSAIDFATFTFYDKRCTVTGNATGNFSFDFTSTSLDCEPVGFEDEFPEGVLDFGSPIFGMGTFTAEADGFVTSAPSSHLTSDPVVLRLQPERGTITGEISLDDGSASAGSLSGITATVVDKPAESVGTVEVTVDGKGQISASEAGQAGVTPGPYEIRFAKSGYDPATVTICVAPGDTACTAPFDQLDNDASTTLERQGRVTVNAVSRPDPTKPADPDTNAQRALTGVTFTLTPEAGGTGRQLTAGSTADGVTFEGVSAGSYLLTGSRASFEAPATALSIEVQVGEHDSNNLLVFKRFGSISGRLVGVTGDGSTVLSGVTITATGPGAATTTFRATTDNLGRFTIVSDLPDAKLTDGKYALSTTGLGSRGFEDLDRSGTSAVQVTNADETALGDVKVSATPASISGTVTDDGTGDPISGARVYLYRDTADGRQEASTSTGTDGTYEIADLTPAIWNLEVSKTGYGTDSTKVDLVSDRDFTYDTELALLRNTVLGTVEGRFGTKDVPLGDVGVTITDVATKKVVDTDTTASDGTYRVDGLPDGSYQVAFAKAGFTGTTALVDPKGGVTRRVDAVLVVKRRDVTVTVTSAVGDAPIDSASVTLVADDGDDDTGATVGPSSTDGEGVVTFEDVLPGGYTIDVAAGGGHLGTSKALTVPISDDTSAVDAPIEVTEAEITGTVTYDDGTTSDVVEGAVVIIFAGPDADVAVDKPLRVVSTDDKGVYRVFVRPGTYTLLISYGDDSAQVDLSVKAGESKGSSPSLEAAGTIEVTVTDEGKDITNAEVVVEDAAGNELDPTSTSGGVYTFSDLPPGDYSVTATSRDGKSAGTASVTLDPGETETIEIELEVV